MDIEHPCERSVNGNHIWSSYDENTGLGRYVRTCVACGRKKEVDPAYDYAKVQQMLKKAGVDPQESEKIETGTKKKA